jgi:hypothetical protein
MRKLLLLLTLCIWFTLPLLCALFIPAAHAGPINWMNRHKRFLAMEGAATGSALIGAWGLSHCRLTGVEKCTGRYGAVWAIYGTGVGINFGMTAVAEACWKQGGDKSCYPFAYGGSAIQAGYGLHEYYLGGHSEESKPDLSSVVIVRH